MSELLLPAGLTAIDSPLPGIKVDTPAAQGVIYFNGAHVAEWTPADARPVLWMSEKSLLEEGKAIRGGVPVIFPWFGTGPDGDQTPQHGLARLAQWHLTHAKVSESGIVTMSLTLPIHELDAPDIPADCTVELHVSMGRALMLQLVVTAGTQPVSFEAALHTYFAVSDITQVRIEGLDATSYADKVSGGVVEQSGPVTFSGETDRVYESHTSTRIIDEGWQREIMVEKVGSAQTVVWNPWIDKSAAMPDFGDDEWPGMVCVEAVNSREQAITVRPGDRHLMSQTISLL